MKHSLSEPAHGRADMIAAHRRFAKVANAARLPARVGNARREGEYFRRESNKVLQVLTNHWADCA